MAFKYEVDGKTFRSEVELTPQEIEELTASLGASPKKEAGFLEAIQRGLTSIPAALLSSGAAQLEGATMGQVPALPNQKQLTPKYFQQGMGVDVTTPYPKGFRGAVLSGVEAAASPESYLFPPLAAVKRAPLLAQLLLRPAEQAVVGTGASGGAQIGEIGGQKVDMPVTGQVVGGLLGGGGTAYAAGTGMKALELGVEVGGKAWNLSKSQWEKVKGTVPEDELMKDVDNRISNIFIAAGAADPEYMKKIVEAARAQESVYLKAPGGAKMQMPISSMLADNPVINNIIQSLSSKDPVFRAQYGKQFEDAKLALAQNQKRIFGDPSKITAEVSAKGKLIEPLDLAKPQQRKIRSIDQQIADLSEDRTLDPTVLGQRISALVAQKEDDARKAVAPLYTEAFNIAKNKSLELPAASVDDIYNFVAGSQASDIFKTFPSIYNRVRVKFKPEVVEPSAILTAEGKPAIEGGRKFTAATIEDLDSLKREINKQLRKTDDPADIRLLTELKQRVGGHIEGLDPDFVAAYRNADNAYLQKVGLPFNAETLKSVDRKKFVEQISPAIIGNKSNASEFIAATGPDGLQIVKDAFYDSFSKVAIKNDAIDPKAARAWLKKNKGAISIVPGLEDELTASVSNIDDLIRQKNRVNTAFEKVAGEQILGKEGMESPQRLISKMYSDIGFTNKFMSQYGANKDAVNAARAFLLDDIVNSADPVALLNDRNKAAVFNRVFGPTYAQKIKDFGIASDRLTKDLTNVPFRVETVPKTRVEELTGIAPEQIISRIYNPVSGPIYAITSLFSKYWAKTASGATEEKLKALLLNPSDAVKVFESVQPKVSGFDKSKIDDAIRIGKKYGIQWVADAVNDLQTGATRGVYQGVGAPAPVPQESEQQ